MRSPISLSMLRKYSNARCSAGLGHASLEVPYDIGHQPVALLIVHDLSHQGAGLAPVVVILSQSVGGADEFAAGLPALHRGIALAVGLRAALRVGCVDGVGHVLDRIAPSLL